MNIIEDNALADKIVNEDIRVKETSIQVNKEKRTARKTVTAKYIKMEEENYDEFRAEYSVMDSEMNES